MALWVAWGNIRQPFPFERIPAEFISDSLRQNVGGTARLQQRHQCRRLAHFLLWSLLEKTPKSTALLARIKRTQSGRPYFENSHLDFNMSHSGDWVAVALQTGNASHQWDKNVIGIDIEIPKQRNFSALLAHFAPPQEQNWFGQQKNMQEAFYRCWCLREAVLKSQGVGIVKLSEVVHEAKSKRIFTAYCPPGRLWYSSEWPFYFALFSNQGDIRPQIFSWNNTQFVECPLHHSLLYTVN